MDGLEDGIGLWCHRLIGNSLRCQTICTRCIQRNGNVHVNMCVMHCDILPFKIERLDILKFAYFNRNDFRIAEY
jgi:hypothetical protein